MEYNTTREKLTLREYGRNFHKLINHVKEVKAKAKRTSLSKTLVKLNEIQTAYMAALKSGATIMNQSLLDYV